MLIDDIKKGESERLEFKERPNVAIYDDRLEITSPGRLKRGVTVQKMLDGCSDCRNEALALALSYMNYIEDWGSGIPRVRVRMIWGLTPLAANGHKSAPTTFTVGDTKLTTLRNLGILRGGANAKKPC